MIPPHPRKEIVIVPCNLDACDKGGTFVFLKAVEKSSFRTFNTFIIGSCYQLPSGIAHPVFFMTMWHRYNPKLNRIG